MKKILLLNLLFFYFHIGFGQINLENIYPNVYSTVTKHFSVIKLDSLTEKYVIFDPNASQFTLYNSNHSVYLNVQIPINYQFGSSQYQIAYISKSLFDCDSSNIEYALSYLGSGTPDSYPKKFYVFRTDGTQFAFIDSCCFMNYSDGWKYGPTYNSPIINTLNGTKLLLRGVDGSARVYSLCGNLNTTGLITNTKEITNLPFPNPSSSFITLPYSLPSEDNSGELVILNELGQIIKKFNIDKSFNSLLLDMNDFIEGNYFYKIQSASKSSELIKIIKTE